MKLIRARFENFRLLRSLEIDFSVDPERNLTVIRAANETGKTTILNALQWGLFGDAALPGKGEGYRLHPIDWDPASEGYQVPILVEVDFEVVRVNKGREVRRQYKLMRTAQERISGTEWSRGATSMRVFQSLEAGTPPMPAPEAFIHDELPIELREVFFTDGDRALSFIEADVALRTKRERVQGAIRSLLGLDILESAGRHVKKTEAEVNKQARGIGCGADIESLSVLIEQIDSQIEAVENERDDAQEQFLNLDAEFARRERQLGEALKKGDKSALQADFDAAKRNIKRIDDLVAGAAKEHAGILVTPSLARDLLAATIGPVFARLDVLKDKNEIPNTSVPVLEERLTNGFCICGECLNPATAEAGDIEGTERRVHHIKSLIEQSRDADVVKRIVTDLYYYSRGLRPLDDPRQDRAGWIAEYARTVDKRGSLEPMRDEAGRKLKGIEVQISQLDDTDVQEIQEQKRVVKQQRDDAMNRQTRAETRLEGLRQDHARHKTDLSRLMSEQSKGARILAELTVVQDISTVLKRAFDRMTTEELRKVSAEMNAIFLEMIGADPEQGAIIQQAEINQDFDIIVYGPDRRLLNPDRDLNGASRRALTLAFILALTKVSEIEAPNVIDTPLGMMSGYVKRSVLRKAVQESSQLVLFLTHSEIEGCEDILDKAAGRIITLTNPAHFPTMLTNDSRTGKRTVLRCDCDHRSDCDTCRRRPDAEQMSMAS